MKSPETGVPADARIVVIGLARDCAHSLVQLLDWFSDLGTEVADWEYVFLENGSTDDTLKLLQEFDGKHQRGVVRTFDNLDAKIPQRTARLAYLRNKALELVNKHERIGVYDFALIVDLDNINEIFPKAKILSHLRNWPDGQAAVFANQTALYYDAWAYRHPEFSPGDCWELVREKSKVMSKRAAKYSVLDKIRKPWPLDAGMIEVDSAFGGLGIYKLSFVEGCEYLGINGNGDEICEHVEFHHQIRENGGKLFIDAAMINGSGRTRHGPSVFRRVQRQLSKLFGAG